MQRNDRLVAKKDARDAEQYRQLIKKAYQARKQIETGFIDLAESIVEIHARKLYRLDYDTFDDFCREELGFSRQTIYIYISILKLIRSFPDQFSREVAIEYGHKKMRHITEGVNKIERRVADDRQKTDAKHRLFKAVNPDMPSTEIESKIDDIVQEF